MQVAEVLSDLTTLYLADRIAALALVQARPTIASPAAAETVAKDEDNDPDLHRPKSLLELHAEVKVAHQDGTDRELNEARSAVERVMNELNINA